MSILDNECIQRFKLGFLMGGFVGASMGVLLGTYSVLRYGHHGDGFLRVVGRSALQSGSMFGLFMGIGGLIRCESTNLCTESFVFTFKSYNTCYHDHYKHPLSIRKW